MALPTWVESINGYSGTNPFQTGNDIVLDSTDIYFSGSSGSTVKSKCQSMANGMRILTVEQVAGATDFCLKVASYPLSL